MPGRLVPLINNQIYHVFNRGIALQPIFFEQRDYQRLLQTVVFYQNQISEIRFSKFLQLSLDERNRREKERQKEAKFWVEIICYCFMPNHWHFLLKQLVDGGISKFMSNIANSYTRYLNTKKKRKGPFFQGKFEAVRIESNEQLLHVSRYIHLNPYSSFVVKEISRLEGYFYSSFPEYLGLAKREICQKEIILGQFKDKENYRKFVLDQADYQRKLEEIKHLVLEKEVFWA